MEIVSEPTYVEEVVTDVDIAYVAGNNTFFTLRGADKMVNKVGWINVTMGGFTTDINKANVLWISRRERVMRTLVKTTKETV